MTTTTAAKTPDELLRLCQNAEPPCVTLLMPTHRAGPETREDPIRFKNLIERAEAVLLKRGVDRSDAHAVLAPARRLHDDPEFWRHRDLGLAVLLDRRGEHVESLPYEVDEDVVVDDQFAVRPLLGLLDGVQRFYVMALSQKRPRLLVSSDEGLEEVDLPSRFKDIDELRAFIDSEKSVQFHTGTAPASGGGAAGGPGSRSAVFHGQGVADNEAKTRALELLNRLDEALERTLRGRRAPLVPVGVDWVVAAFRETCSYPHLTDNSVEGNFDHLSDRELFDKALEVVKPIFERRRKNAAKTYEQAAGSARGTTDIQRILQASSMGQVATLLVSAEDQIWGQFDPTSGEAQVRKERETGARDLIEVAALHSLAQGADVHALPRQEMPAGAPIAAVLRPGAENVA